MVRWTPHCCFSGLIPLADDKPPSRPPAADVLKETFSRLSIICTVSTKITSSGGKQPFRRLKELPVRIYRDVERWPRAKRVLKKLESLHSVEISRRERALFVGAEPARVETVGYVLLLDVYFSENPNLKLFNISCEFTMEMRGIQTTNTVRSRPKTMIYTAILIPGTRLSDFRNKKHRLFS